MSICFFFFFSSRRRHTRLQGDWSSDVCSSDLARFDVDDLDVGVGQRKPHRAGLAPGKLRRRVRYRRSLGEAVPLAEGPADPSFELLDDVDGTRRAAGIEGPHLIKPELENAG